MKKVKKITETPAAAFSYRDIKPADILIDDGWNPRRDFDEEHLFALSESLKETGQAQMIAVNSTAGKNGLPEYHLISGERRLRAAIEAGLETIGCKVYHDLDIRTMTDLMFSENFQRQDLKHIEQASAMQRMEEVGFSVAEIARRVGVSDDTVRRKISLLDLPDEVQKMVDRPTNPLPIHQAQLLVGLAESDCLRLARQAAPIVGPVASEQQVREWVDTLKNGPRLPMKEDDRPRNNSAAKTGGKVLSNIRHDPDKDEGENDVIGEPSDNIVIDLKTVQKLDGDGDFKKPYEYHLPLPKSLKQCKLVVHYATDGKMWYSGHHFHCPVSGSTVHVSPKNEGFDSSFSAVLNGLEALQEQVDKAADAATVKTQKQNMQTLIEILGKEMDAIRAKYVAVQENPTPETPAEGYTMYVIAGSVGITGKIAINQHGGIEIQSAMISFRLKSESGEEIYSCKLAAVPMDIPAKNHAAVFELIKKCQPKKEDE